MRSFYFLFYWILVSLLFTHCANIGQPDGGARDLEPPVIDSSASTPNLKINFHPDRDKSAIILKFREWIKLEDAFKQVVISPPLQYTPKIELKGKGVQVKLDPREVLKEQTTYTINFGNAVKDITEGNAAIDLRYVFSTGDIIDTAYVAGKTIDALNGETKENLLVMLYESNEDTVVYKNRPTYFSRTNKEGRFTIRNIKDSTYKIFVLEDGNSNYLYDQDKELIGFLDRRVKSGEDSTALLLSYYKSFVRPRITAYNTELAGIVKIQTNASPDDLRTESLLDTIQLYPLVSKDTLLVYYTPITARDWNIKVSFEEKPLDTLLVNKIKRATLDTLRAIRPSRELLTLGPDQFSNLEFNQPISRLDTTRIVLYDDTLKKQLPHLVHRGETAQHIKLFCPCLEKHSYTLTILPDAIYNFNGNILSDTVMIKMNGLMIDQSGTLYMQISNLDSSKHYIIALIQGENTLSRDKVTGLESWSKIYLYLPPSSYNIQIIEDRNDNGRWDAGDYLRKIQPEKILTQKNYSVRANWELKEQINWKP